MLGVVRRLDVIHVGVGDSDILGPELAAETSTVKGGTENGSFIYIHVNRNLAFSNSGLHGMLNHRRSGGAAGEDNRRDILLQKEMSWQISGNGL